MVNDATSSLPGTNTAYKYQASGTPQAPYGLSLNDLDPRGVASNAAGTKQWVVDANKNVYVYSPGGTLLGSWSAGGLPSTANVTGIATNGTDIWLVDPPSAKVYKYSGAAGLLSGSQNASSSFSLAGGKNGDPNPQDIVTDGTSFWVVDGTKLKVFKYTLSGSLLGSWSIDPANTHPTGITINPNNVSDIWIVDSGTLKVYQYVGAASRTSGSQSAGATFALAAANTNPQGIADPPAADMLLTPAAAPLAPNPSNTTAPEMPAVPSLTARDAVFTEMVREPLQRPAERAIDVLAGVALTAHAESPTPIAGRPWTSAGASGAVKPLDRVAPFTSENGQGLGSDRSAVDLLDGTWTDEGSTASAAATDLFAAGLGDDAPAEE